MVMTAFVIYFTFIAIVSFIKLALYLSGRVMPKEHELEVHLSVVLLYVFTWIGTGLLLIAAWLLTMVFGS